MPDWSYQTLFRPLLFRLPNRLARSVTLGAIGTLSRLPLGSFVIRTLGHMEPAPLIRSQACGVDFITPVGLSGTVDPSGTAHRAVAQFGLGFIEIGPITTEPILGASAAPIQLNPEERRIAYPSYGDNDGLAVIAARIAKPGHQLPQFARLTPLPGSTPEQSFDQLLAMIRQLREAGAAGFYLDILQQPVLPGPITALLQLLAASNVAQENRLFLYIPHDLSEQTLRLVLNAADFTAWSGAVVGEARASEGGLTVRPTDKQSCAEKLTWLRRYGPQHFVLKAACGVYEPQDALDLIAAGADYILLHGGLIDTGPGLPKRVNEAILHERVRLLPMPKPESFWRHWGWMCLLGIGMIIGGMLAWIIATTTVLLPYDEAFLGINRDTLHHLNHRLLHFMSHDRITLAGTMISIGVLYYQLGRHGLRYGMHWARIALLVSGITGFASFFLYLGYGYFDPLHAVVALILLPLFLLSMRVNPDKPFRNPVNLRSDRTWKRAIWGQFCMVVLGFALVIGSITISGFGVTRVFVPQDLDYIGLTSEQISAINSRLVPLIAHDRAGFGGALFSDALALLTMALWGIQQGERWLWWTFLIGGAPAFFAAFSVHWHIGYTDFVHLSPAFFALLLYIVGLILLYPYLTRSPVTGVSAPHNQR
ncbi:hypothetical protein [Paenibacillus sp. CF384]|uniref:hypothetical protein n=1 Tax=Paenibacillus sp. CF384 TaxID=1884382 RepID=UPI00089514C3|nr:hypothetical protein [Paenibacillus sp. CF384]SDX87113.1 Dihydroorotate dehydrogenase [Paenibacillus sp. CF384]